MQATSPILENNSTTLATMKIILGSQSGNRRMVLKNAGYEFEVMASDIDEKAIRHDDFYELPLLLAKAKAAALLPHITKPALLITADQVIVWNGELREKPRDLAEARQYLETFSGSDYPAECVNGVMVTNTVTGASLTEREISKVYFRKIPQDIIEDFLRKKIGFTKAGGFDAYHPLLQPFIRVEGTMESVLGLPMDVVERCMKELP